MLKDKNCQTIIYPAKLSFKYEGEMRTFSGKRKKKYWKSSPHSWLIRNVEGSCSTVNKKTEVYKTLSKVIESENCNSITD